MFICNDCAIKNKVDAFVMLTATKSKGPCEICHKTDICMDIHHSLIQKEDSSKIIQDINEVTNYEENIKKKKAKNNRARILDSIADNEELLEIGRKAIEDELVSFRDDRISVLGRGNGLVIREKDGQESSTIRFGPEDALRIGLKAIAKHIEEGK